MNIKEAKEQIRIAMQAYLAKDEYGDYEIPMERQRPVFLMGPPGIGKTAIMEQLARELDVAFVSYSMTHHTRQSALGLPYIAKKTYGGREFSVSEYTMSEIIAAVYDAMEATGKREGILFLDEINCVSETLAPAMLQFLQFKVFGRHAVPAGWIVVTAGNPPEYNRSVREFDIVTWDRLKRIDAEPDYDAWKEYAYLNGVHPAILAYLDGKKSDFYRVETTAGGKSFVTARGWSDLSEMIRLCEKRSLPVEEKLVSQYLQNQRVARDFAVSYDLFRKYRSDYQIPAILAGDAPAEIADRARRAPFDEKLALLGLLLDALTEEFKELSAAEAATAGLLNAMREIRISLSEPGEDVLSALDWQMDSLRSALAGAGSSLAPDAAERARLHKTLDMLSEQSEALRRDDAKDSGDALRRMKADYDRRMTDRKAEAETAEAHLANAFDFCRKAFAGGQELLIFVTELSVNPHTAAFIARHGSADYATHSRELLFYERHREINAALAALDGEA